MRHTIVSIMWIVSLLLVFYAGHRLGQQSVQSANDLLSVGFHITDPAGFDIHDFD